MAPHEMASSLEELIAEGQALQSSGRLEEAWTTFASALETAGTQTGDVLDVFNRGIAALSLAHMAMEQHRWTEVRGKSLDLLLLESVNACRASKGRSRTLEGCLLQVRSQMLFEKPDADSAAIDAAISARQEATVLLIEGAVEALSWKAAKVEKLIANAQSETVQLSEDELQERLKRAGARPGDAEYVTELFEAWARPGISGMVLSLLDFLSYVLEIIQNISKDSARCSAPCEGGLSSDASHLEKELVALVSRHGTGAWEAKASEMLNDFPDVTAQLLESTWRMLAPKIKKTVEGDEQMSCGHKCSTCPTRQSCQVHDALKDIEDL
eukprot:TRINITY_DN9523_c0_g1_i2.p1 TRINITY_DN9523_c0_g1~~TRINITY_DN9523_c0_g1_i2.p1  ORF type:complete len:342 (-),score=80.74 TRINITY_DN9523_c0_g1_i2:143-1120(-)